MAANAFEAGSHLSGTFHELSFENNCSHGLHVQGSIWRIGLLCLHLFGNAQRRYSQQAKWDPSSIQFQDTCRRPQAILSFRMLAKLSTNIPAAKNWGVKLSSTYYAPDQPQSPLVQVRVHPTYTGCHWISSKSATRAVLRGSHSRWYASMRCLASWPGLGAAAGRKTPTTPVLWNMSSQCGSGSKPQGWIVSLVTKRYPTGFDRFICDTCILGCRQWPLLSWFQRPWATLVQLEKSLPISTDSNWLQPSANGLS